jgi:thimet oligopeptidase
MVFPFSPPQGPDYPALSYIVCNMNRPELGRQALMKHAELKTFFHEFGHAIHSILGRNQFSSLCGMSVKWDFVELPSILLENWVWDPTILKMVSSHYLTGDSLPDEWIQNMLEARDFGQGSFVEMMCFRSELSLAFFDGSVFESPTQLMRDVWARALPRLSAGDNNHFHASWWHFSNYGPKYYSYLWSQVFACDVFEKIQQGGLLNPEVGAAYARAILSKGGSRDPEEMLVDFLGREPTINNFLKQLD